MLFQLIPQILHLSHVRMNYGFNKTLSEELYFTGSHLVAHEIVLILIKNLKRLCHVEALLYVRFAVHQVAVGLRDHVELIVESIMSNIVAQRSHKQRQCVDVVKLGQLAHVLCVKDVMAVLCHVRSMQVVVVRHGPVVLVVYLDYELQKLVLINCRTQSIYFNDSRSNRGHLHSSADDSGKVKYVELEGRNAIVQILVLL